MRGECRKPTKDPFNPEFKETPLFKDAYPASTKEAERVVHAETGHAFSVPFRRIHLEDEDPGCQHIDVYDTR